VRGAAETSTDPTVRTAGFGALFGGIRGSTGFYDKLTDWVLFVIDRRSPLGVTAQGICRAKPVARHLSAVPWRSHLTTVKKVLAQLEREGKACSSGSNGSGRWRRA
jgi:hypothetical protein